MQPDVLAGSSGNGTPPMHAVEELLSPATSALPDEVPVTIVRPSRNVFDLGLRNLWAYRELLYYIVWRTVKVRYKQTAIGVLWVVLQPVLTMLIFTFVFGHLAKLPTNGVPYPLFVYSGLLPWNLFAAGLTGVSTSIVANSSLISKVYFPRLIIPIATVLAGLVDFLISMGVFAGLLVYYHTPLRKPLVTLPFFVGLAVVAALAVGLWLSILNVRFRDVQYTIPFLSQAWLFLTPVAYAATLIPPKWRLLVGLNPMTSVVDGFRWIFVAEPRPFNAYFGLSIAVVLALLLGGIVFFRRMEKTFADVI